MDEKQRIIIKNLLDSKFKDSEEFMPWNRRFCKEHGVLIMKKADIIKSLSEYAPENDKEFAAKEKIKKILKKRAVRTMSGIAPVAVLTKPYPCPGKCAYCPTEKDVPQSYLSNEPAVMRAIRCGFDPYVQVHHRIKALIDNGHEPTKIELIVIGGTWSYLPEKYKFWYISECFRAANEFSKKFPISNFQFPINIKYQISNIKTPINKLKQQLLIEQKKNEKAKYQLIGITLETRPDYISEKEVLEMRELGATRVELGVQAIDDGILKLNKRGHGIKEVADATKMLKDFGFKVTYHIMPGLRGSTAAKDLKMFKQLFSDERFQPDQIKFYPTVVTKGSLLYRWWRDGKYKPYSDKTLQNLIVKCKEAVPPYVRIIRLIRDIPGESIMAGNKITNLRQVMQQRHVKCDCIRCREAKEGKLEIRNLKLEIIKYAASGGEEYFLQYIDKENILYAFCRLRIPSRNMEPVSPADGRITHNAIKNAAFIRELHVYGELVSIGNKKKTQHAGLGKKLMLEAEKIARQNGFKKIAVISGVGVRGYYRKLGYRLKGTYMVKSLI